MRLPGYVTCIYDSLPRSRGGGASQMDDRRTIVRQQTGGSRCYGNWRSLITKMLCTEASGVCKNILNFGMSTICHHDFVRPLFIIVLFVYCPCLYDSGRQQMAHFALIRGTSHSYVWHFALRWHFKLLWQFAIIGHFAIMPHLAFDERLLCNDEQTISR